jgi:hypothetical protein
VALNNLPYYFKHSGKPGDFHPPKGVVRGVFGGGGNKEA